MAFKERFYAALEGLLEDKGITGATVIDFDEVTKYGGYCSTCAYEYTAVVITYEIAGIEQTFEYDDSFSDLINTLAKY